MPAISPYTIEPIWRSFALCCPKEKWAEHRLGYSTKTLGLGVWFSTQVASLETSVLLLDRFRSVCQAQGAAAQSRGTYL
jgi:hypothetical protein